MIWEFLAFAALLAVRFVLFMLLPRVWYGRVRERLDRWLARIAALDEV